MMMQVFVKYPAGHHRAIVAPGWTAWGDREVDCTRAGGDREIQRMADAARRQGCKVRIARAGARFK